MHQAPTTPSAGSCVRPSPRRRPGALPAAALLVALTSSLAGPGHAAAAFGFDDVAERASALAQEPFQRPEPVPRWLLQIGYDEWRGIRFRPEQALWRGASSSFTVQFFHPGLFYDRPVAVNVVEAKGPRPLPFSPAQFDYGANEFASRVPQDLGFAGFRIHHPLKRPDYHDEVIVFLGASYFRAVGRRQGFGLSARGLAVDTALPSGEEFPWFREFWLVRPAAQARETVVYALLDSPRLTGAYGFVITPGEQTRVAVRARLFLREPIEKLGFAPLTSMFLRGEGARRGSGDYRPEVHDSDGLLIETGDGEWIWRPLDNPPGLSMSSFAVQSPKGFGLVQRDRNFEHYQDLEARSEERPSLWIAPEGDWGVGRVELVEIPTDNEANDNVVAYWVPGRRPAPGTPVDLAYTQLWYGDDPSRPPAGRAVATRLDRGGGPDAWRFVVDFEGKELRALPAETVLRGVVTVGGSEEHGALLEQQVYKNAVTGGWRLVFRVRAPEDEPLELRAFLEHGTDVLTETWSYLLRP
jgi:glucans biosynthesis protein